LLLKLCSRACDLVPISCSFLPSGRAAGGGPKESARVEAYLSAEEEDEMPEELREGLAQRVGEVFGRCRELAFDSTSHRSTITTPAIATAPLGWNDRMLVDGANNAVPKMNRVPRQPPSPNPASTRSSQRER
jgi:hypothetical protein